MNLPILNNFRHGDIDDRRWSLSLVEAVCIANREADRPVSCGDCASFGHESDGGEPEYAVSWPVCHRFSGYANLRTFPFKSAPARCFSLDFWSSAYAGADRGNILENPPLLKVWRAADERGRFHGPALAAALSPSVKESPDVD